MLLGGLAEMGIQGEMTLFPGVFSKRAGEFSLCEQRCEKEGTWGFTTRTGDEQGFQPNTGHALKNKPI